MGSQQQQICLRWNNHQMNLLSVFDHLLQSEAFVDVTLACDGLSLKAHKMVLSACSPFFQKLLLDNPCQHPIVILNNVEYDDLKALIDFMYKGEVSVGQDQLPALLRTAENLKVKGLSEVTPGDHTVAGSAEEQVTQSSVVEQQRRPSLASSSTIEHVNPCGSPAGKRKKLRPRRKSLTEDNCGTTVDNNCSPPPQPSTVVDIKEDVGSMSGDGGARSALEHLSSVTAAAAAAASSSSSSSSSKGHDGNGDCLPEARVHEGFSQENEEGQGSSLDASNFLGMPPYSTSHHHQYGDQQQQQQQHHHHHHHNQSTTLHPCLPHTQSSSTSTSSAHHHAQDDTTVDNGNNNTPQVNSTALSVQSQQQQQQQTPTSNKQCGGEIGGGTIESTRSDHWESANVDVNHALEAALRHHQVRSRTGSSPYGTSSSLSTMTLPSTAWAVSQSTVRPGGVAKRDVCTDSPSTTTTNALAIPKREYSLSSSGCTTGWTEDSLAQALDAIRSGRMSITKAAVTYGIPNTTLWQRTRREGIDTSRNGASCHQATTGWTESNLALALEAVRSGRMSVNRASTTYGIPSTTLWSRAKRYGIETHRRLPGGGVGSGGYEPHERDEVMWHALQAVKAGVISMTQASIKYNLPYTTLWKHFKKWEMAGGPLTIPLSMSHSGVPSIPSSAAMVMAGGGGGAAAAAAAAGHHHHHHHHSSHVVATSGGGPLHSHPIDSIVGEQTTAT